MLRRRLAESGIQARVRSVGLLRAGNPASEIGVELLAARGIDISSHRSRTVTREILLGADLVVAMAREHVREAAVAAPEVWDRTFTLKELVRRGEQVGARRPGQSFDSWLERLSSHRAAPDLMGTSVEDDIHDPLGKPRAAYEQLVAELDDLLDRFLALGWGQAEAAPVARKAAGAAATEAPAIPATEAPPAEVSAATEPTASAAAEAAVTGAVEAPEVSPPAAAPAAGIDDLEPSDVARALAAVIGTPTGGDSFAPTTDPPTEQGGELQGAEPEVGEPAPGEPMIGEPATTRPATPEPAAPERAVGEPVFADAVAPDAVVAEPPAARPVTPEPLLAEPVMAEAPPTDHARAGPIAPPGPGRVEPTATLAAASEPPEPTAPEPALTEAPVPDQPAEPPPSVAAAPEGEPLVAEVVSGPPPAPEAPVPAVAATSAVAPTPESAAPAPPASSSVAPPATFDQPVVLVAPLATGEGAPAQREPVSTPATTRVVIGSDRAGLRLKAHLAEHLRQKGHSVDDVGTYTEDSVDYPDFGLLVGRVVAEGHADVGVCVDGTGIGIGIVANKVAGVRAAIVHDVTSAQMARRHNDANVICLGARLLGRQVAVDAVDAFLAARFEGGPHRRRVDRISAIEATVRNAREPQGPWAVPQGPGGADEELFGIIGREVERQNTTLQLIASENFTSPAVLAAQGSVLTNKYSEGYPGRRYYGGNYVVDEAEELARERAKLLFGAEHANVQPHSGANANMAAYLALLEPGDTVLGMRLDQGGHLTHGSPVNFSGRLYRFVSYGVTESDERLDLDQIRDLALTERPKAIVAGATAYPRIIDPEALRAICDEVGALFIFDAAHVAGLVAGGVHPNPVPFADVVTFTTHKTLRGPRAGGIVCKEAHAKAIDKAVFPGLQGGPLMHVIAAKAVAFHEAAQPSFRQYAAQIVRNARALAHALAGEGFRLVSGATENHLMLVDLRPFDPELSGKVAQDTLERAGITLNKNQIPGDPRSPFVTSGLRIGTPAVTTAGMAEEQMSTIASLIGRALRGAADRSPDGGEATLHEVREAVATLCSKFTPYPGLSGR